MIVVVVFLTSFPFAPAGDFWGPWAESRLHVGDVLEVNIQNVAGKYLEDVIVLMKGRGNFLSSLVKEQTGYAERQERTRPKDKVRKTRLDWWCQFSSSICTFSN